MSHEGDEAKRTSSPPESDGRESNASSGELRGRAANSRGTGEEETTRGTCELCGGETLERHCKIVCLRCGYVRDCSDP